MILTGLEFQRIGKALYGRAWARIIADKLDRSLKTVKRYGAGVSNVPPALKPELKELIDEQIKMLKAIQAELSEENMWDDIDW